MRTQSSPIVRIFTLITLTTTIVLAACEDVPPAPARKAAPAEPPKSVAVAPPSETPALPMPTPAVTGPATPGKVVVVADDDDVDEDDVEPREALGYARDALDSHDFVRALKLAKLAVDHAPRRSAAWNVLGRAQMQLGKRKLAIASFGKAIELNPSNPYPQNNLALAFIYENRYAEAADALEEAVQQDGAEGYMWNNLGIAYEHLDRLDEAREAYRKGAELNSDGAALSLVRLEGVKSVVRTAKVDAVEPKLTPGALEGKAD